MEKSQFKVSITLKYHDINSNDRKVSKVDIGIYPTFNDASHVANDLLNGVLSKKYKNMPEERFPVTSPGTGIVHPITIITNKHITKHGEPVFFIEIKMTRRKQTITKLLNELDKAFECEMLYWNL